MTNEQKALALTLKMANDSGTTDNSIVMRFMLLANDIVLLNLKTVEEVKAAPNFMTVFTDVNISDGYIKELIGHPCLCLNSKIVNSIIDTRNRRIENETEYDVLSHDGLTIDVMNRFGSDDERHTIYIQGKSTDEIIEDVNQL